MPNFIAKLHNKNNHNNSGQIDKEKIYKSRGKREPVEIKEEKENPAMGRIYVWPLSFSGKADCHSTMEKSPNEMEYVVFFGGIVILYHKARQ